ncbi:MAG TPA: hypothetical protein VGT40_23365 [Methylomirabilota bacterium]|nr:hypothetical protein [Methylomirabilota bacterium]
MRWTQWLPVFMAGLTAACSSAAPPPRAGQVPPSHGPMAPASSPARLPPAEAPGLRSVPPVLSPDLADGERVRGEVSKRLGRVSRIIDGIDPAKLAKDQREMYASVRDFAGKARAALSTNDLAGAQVLSEKAAKLADELAAAQ